MGDWTRSDYLQLLGSLVGALVAFTIYLLQQQLSDKQKIDHRLNVENIVGDKLYDIHYKDSNSEVQLYNSKLIGKRYFAKNKRSFWWGYPYHAAEIYIANFDGLEFVVGLEEWDNKKYYKVGLIPYERVLGVSPKGDSSFNGMIFYVKPRLLQFNKYSIAYTKFRYYPTELHDNKTKKPLYVKFHDGVERTSSRLKYFFYYKWKNNSRTKL